MILVGNTVGFNQLLSIDAKTKNNRSNINGPLCAPWLSSFIPNYAKWPTQVQLPYNWTTLLTYPLDGSLGLSGALSTMYFDLNLLRCEVSRHSLGPNSMGLRSNFLSMAESILSSFRLSEEFTAFPSKPNVEEGIVNVPEHKTEHWE